MCGEYERQIECLSRVLVTTVKLVIRVSLFTTFTLAIEISSDAELNERSEKKLDNNM